MTIRNLPPSETTAARNVLCSAFRDYPVMRYVIGEGGDYENQLKSLIGFYIDLRYECGWPVMGVEDNGAISAVALVNPPTDQEWISETSSALKDLQKNLDPAAFERLVAFEEASAGSEPNYPHYFLGMIGVSAEARGKGLAHQLISGIVRRSFDDPDSRAVVLTTEDARNHRYYERQGFVESSAVDVGDLRSVCFIRAT